MLRLIPALVRQCAAYAELAVAEAAGALKGLRRQLLGVVVLTVAGSIMLLLACLWAIAATWDGPHRLGTIAGLCAGFGLVALAGLWMATRSMPGPAPFERLGSEWRGDLARLAALSGDRQGPAAPAAEPGYAD